MEVILDVNSFIPVLTRELKRKRVILLEILWTGTQDLTPVEHVQHTTTEDFQKITQAIQDKNALACVDAAAKNGAMTYFRIFTNTTNNFSVNISDTTNRWENATSDAAEGRAILGLLQQLKSTIRSDVEGELEILTDSQAAVHWILQPMIASRAAKPCGEIWVEIQRVIKVFDKIKITFRWVKGHPTPVAKFEDNPEAWLISMCNFEARALRAQVETYQEEKLLKEPEYGQLYMDNKRIFRSVNATVREYDSELEELHYFQEKFPSYYHIIDLGARMGGGRNINIARLKCITGFNHYAIRDRMVNKHITSKCDVCNDPESWEHILQCPCTRNDSLEFLRSLETKLKNRSELHEDIEKMVSYLVAFVLGNKNIPGTQQLLGYKYVFRGIIVKDWFGANDAEMKYSVLNKVIVQECVRYYLKAWGDRNDRLNSEKVRKLRLIEWAKNEKNDPSNAVLLNIAKYIDTGYNKVLSMSADAIQQWLVALNMIKKRDRMVSSFDIRSFFTPRK